MKKLKVFMIMPFKEQFLELYKLIKSKLENDYEFSNAGDLDNQRNIIQDIIVGISDADVVIADLTELNSNVFYELGLCHALNKKVILITQEISKLPFDISSYRAIEYSTDFWKIPEIVNKIEEKLIGARDGSEQFGNPVKDYYPKKIENKENEGEQLKTSSIDNEKGFIDFITEINDDTIKLSNEINIMVGELNDLTKDIENGTNKINKVSKISGSDKLNFVRDIARQIGKGIQQFSDKMDIHNNKIESMWGRIENNYLDLIDNKYMESSSNKKILINSLKELNKTKNSIYTSNQGLGKMITTFVDIKGIERKFNQSINSLEMQINKYLSIMNAAYASIDRIIRKAELLVGKIEFDEVILK